jgi:uncharacterized protein
VTFKGEVIRRTFGSFYLVSFLYYIVIYTLKEVVMMHKVIKGVAWVLAVIGALNWGLVGLFNFDLVAFALGAGSMLARVVYSLVGLSALILIGFKVAKKKMKK